MSQITIVKTSMVALSVALIGALTMPLIASAQGNGQGGRPEKVAEKVATHKLEAEKRVKEERATADVKSQEKRQEACEKRVAKLESTMARLTDQSTKLLGVMDSFHNKVQTFYDKGQLTVANYDELNAVVNEKQAAAMTEIKALSELNVAVDCENAEVASTVGAFKTSANASKESLREYRKSLVALISSMKSASADKSSAEDTSKPEKEAENDSTAETPATEPETNTEGTN